MIRGDYNCWRLALRWQYSFSTTLLTILLYIFGKPLIAILFGQEYESAVATNSYEFAYTVSGFWFGHHHTQYVRAGAHCHFYLFSPVAGCALTLALFHNFGVASAAIAMIIVELLKGVWMAYAAKSQLGLSVDVFCRQSCGKTSVARAGSPEGAVHLKASLIAGAAEEKAPPAVLRIIAAGLTL